MRFGKLILIIFAFFTLINLAKANPVEPYTMINVVYPLTFDSDQCDQTAFTGTIASLAIPNIPLSVVYSSIQKDPVYNRKALVVELNQNGHVYSDIRIEGNDLTLNNIQKNLYQGQEIRLTEFERCAKRDKSLQLVELVNFTPSLNSLMPDMDAKIEFIRKNDNGICAISGSKTLKELVKAYNPQVDLSKIEANVYITADGFSTDGNKLVGKDVNIIFNKKGNKFDQLSKPTIRIQVPADLSYTVIERLRHPGDILQMTKTIECKGQKIDNPVWIYNITIS